MAVPRISVVTRGVGELQTTTRRRIMVVRRPLGRIPPIIVRLPQGAGSGNQVWRRFDADRADLPRRRGGLRRWFAWVSCRGEANGPSETALIADHGLGPPWSMTSAPPPVPSEMGQHRNLSRASRARHLLGVQLTQTNADMPAVPRGMSAMLGVKHRCIAWSLRNASPVGSVLIGP